ETTRGSHVKLAREGQHDTEQPGKVHLRVLRFRKNDAGMAPYASRLAGYRAWTTGTRSNLRTGTFKSLGEPALQRAIAMLDGPGGDQALAARAQLVRANGLRLFQLDFRESRAAAQAASQAFRSLPHGDALGEARAKYLEA